MGACITKISFSSYGSSGDDHLNSNVATKIQTTTPILLSVMVWLALTTGLYSHMLNLFSF